MNLKLPAFLIAALLGMAAPAVASSCNVTEFYLTADGGVQVARQPALVDQSPITTSGTSAQSAAFGGDTKLIRAWCDTQSAMVVGANPTATTSNMPLAAGAGEYFQVLPGQKAAFILRP